MLDDFQSNNSDVLLLQVACQPTMTASQTTGEILEEKQWKFFKYSFHFLMILGRSFASIILSLSRRLAVI